MVPLRELLSQAKGQLLANQGRSQSWFWCQIFFFPLSKFPTGSHSVIRLCLPLTPSSDPPQKLSAISSSSTFSILPFPGSLAKKFTCTRLAGSQ